MNGLAQNIPGPREQERYETYLAHLDGCAACQAEDGTCEEGRRLRRALRDARYAAPHDSRRDSGG